jgi:glycosyltransferase involved in cell wall biosynthesis
VALTFRFLLDNFSGYGRHSLAILSHLRRQGHEIRLRPFCINVRDEQYRPTRTVLPELQAEALRPVVGETDELVMLPPGTNLPDTSRRRAWFTMWETTRVDQTIVAKLNRQSCLLVVPDLWNLAVFSGSGYNHDMAVCPLGIDPAVFHPRPFPHGDQFVFGAAGRLIGAGARKRLDHTVRLFRQAFPDDPDVRLHLKVSPEDRVPLEGDSRIVVERRFQPNDHDVADWCAGLSAYLHFSFGEGWGLFPQQAMAVGRPVIGPRFSGTAAFFDDNAGIVLPFQPRRCLDLPGHEFYMTDEHTRGALVAVIDDDAAVGAMRTLRELPALAEELGRRAAFQAARFTLERSCRELESILLAHRFLS